MSDGCVTNFDHGEQRLTIWKSGDHFRLEEFGAGGVILPLTYEPLFQSIAAEMHRLACGWGQEKGDAIKTRRALRAILRDSFSGADVRLLAVAAFGSGVGRDIHDKCDRMEAAHEQARELLTIAPTED